MIAHVRGSVVLGYRARAGVDASVVEQQAQQAKLAGPPPGGGPDSLAYHMGAFFF